MKWMKQSGGSSWLGLLEKLPFQLIQQLGSLSHLGLISIANFMAWTQIYLCFQEFYNSSWKSLMTSRQCLTHNRPMSKHFLSPGTTALTISKKWFSWRLFAPTSWSQPFKTGYKKKLDNNSSSCLSLNSQSATKTPPLSHHLYSFFPLVLTQWPISKSSLKRCRCQSG